MAIAMISKDGFMAPIDLRDAYYSVSITDPSYFFLGRVPGTSSL